MTFGLRRVLFTMFAAILAISLMASLAIAEANVAVHVLKVDGLVTGKKLSVDQAYARKYNKPVGAPFELIIPKIDGVEVFDAFPPKVGGEYFKISFATGKKKLIENLRIIGITVPMGPQDKRLASIKQLFVNQVFPMVLREGVNPQILAGRLAKIDGLDAVEAIAQFEDLREGRVFVWMVAIINPDSPACVLAVSQITSRAEAKQPDDVGKNGITVKALSTFKFTK